MVWVVSRGRLEVPPGISSYYISPLTSSGQRSRASWASQPQKSATLSPQPGGKPRKFIRTFGGTGGKGGAFTMVHIRRTWSLCLGSQKSYTNLQRVLNCTILIQMFHWYRHACVIRFPCLKGMAHLYGESWGKQLRASFSLWSVWGTNISLSMAICHVLVS